MAQFRYRLQMLLEQKVHAKEESERALGVAQRELRTAQDELAACRREQEAMEEKLRRARVESVSTGAGGSTGQMMLFRRDYIARLLDEVDEAADATRAQELTVADAEERLAAVRKELPERSRDVEVLEKHRAKLERRFNDAVSRKEALDQEEMANVIFLQRREQ
jgi:flagellar biosynthesis chaperone FliJ